jgi:thiol-disulfide isomerase/thioredoxin
MTILVATLTAALAGTSLGGCAEPSGPAAPGTGPPSATAAPAATATPTGTAPTGTAPTGTAPTGTAGAAPPAAAVPESLRFRSRTVDGREFDGASLAGRPAVLWFWAPWCPTCRRAAPDVVALQDRYAGRVTVLGVGGLDRDGSMPAFVQQTGSGALTHLADGSGEVWRRYGVTSQHTFVLIARDGSVAHRGTLSADELARRVAGLAG